MEHTLISDTLLDAPLLDFLRDERKKALSAREWKFRLAGYGYGIREDNGRCIVTQLRDGATLGLLPVNFH